MEEKKLHVLIEIVDYEHEGDVRYALNELSNIDPNYTYVRKYVSREDPESDCDQCEIEVIVNEDKLNEIKDNFTVCGIYKK